MRRIFIVYLGVLVALFVGWRLAQADDITLLSVSNSKTASSGTHQVNLDACAASDGFVSSGTSGSFASFLTVGSGSNRALTVFALWGTAGPTGVTVTWDSGGTNQTMTQLALLTQATQTAAIYGLVAPTSGTKTLAFTWTNTAQLIVHGCAWTGVNQTGGVTSFPGAQTAAGAATVTVTSATGDVVVGAEVVGSSFTATTGTNIFIDNARSVIAAAAQRQAGAATVATGATTSATAVAGVDIKAN